MHHPDYRDRNCRELPGRELERASGLPGELAVQAMADVYMNELEALAEGNQADVNVTVTELDAVAAARLVDAPTHGSKSNASAKMQLTFLCLLGRSCGGWAIFRSDGTPVASA